MRPEKLVSMANQIASFFRSYPVEEAAAGINHHLQAFWTPTMLATLEAHLAEGGTQADPLVVRAMTREPAAESPAERAISPLEQTGEMATDAG